MTTKVWLERNLADVTITNPQDGHLLMYDASISGWVNDNLITTGNLYPHDEVSTVDGAYHQLLSSPPDDAETIDVVHITATSGITLIDQYLTEDTFGVTLIPGGSWHFVTYAKVDSNVGVTTIIHRVYEREDGGTENLLFSVTSDEINSTTVDHYENDIVQSDIIVASDSRLVLKCYAQTTRGAPGVDVSLYHEGTDHYSHMHIPWEFQGSGGATTLDALNDVEITTPTDGQVLTYDDGSGLWINDDASGGGHTIVWSGGALPQRTNLRFLPYVHTARNFGEGKVGDVQNWVDVWDDPATDTTWVSISGSFLGLTDAPDDYAANTGEFIRVNANGDGLTFGALNPATAMYQQFTVTSGTSAFTLTNNPVSETAMQVYWNGVSQQHDHFSYTGTTLYTDFVVNVGDEFWVTYLRQGTYIDITENFLALDDTPNTYTGQADKVVVVNDAETALEFVDSTSIGTTTFLGLSDTPDSYAGYTSNEIVQVSGTVLNFTNPNTIGFPMGDLRKVTNINARNCEFLGAPTFSGWNWQVSTGSLTQATASGWVSYVGTAQNYNYNYDVPSHLIVQPAPGTIMKFYTQWSPPPYTNWAVAAKVGLNNARHSNDAITLVASVYGPSAASADPTHGVGIQLKHNGINNDIASFYYNGGAKSGTLTMATTWSTMVYLAILCNAAGELHTYTSIDGINWSWNAIWNNAAYLFNTIGISHVWISTVETAGATNTSVIGTVDWIRFLEGSNNLWELTTGR